MNIGVVLSNQGKMQEAMEKYEESLRRIFLALAGGGKFRTLSPTTHTQINAQIIKKFIDIEVSVKEYGRNQWEIEVWSG